MTNIRAKTRKLEEENTGVNFHDFGFINEFLDITQNEQAAKEKTDELDFIKIKSLCESKGIINKMKIQLIAWEKIFAYHVSEKGLLSKIYKKYNSITKSK